MMATRNQQQRARLLQAVLVLVLVLIVASSFSLRLALGELSDVGRLSSVESSSALLAPIEVPSTEVALPQTPTALQALAQTKLSLTMVLVAIIAAIQVAACVQSPGPLFRVPIPPVGRHQRYRLHAYLN